MQKVTRALNTAMKRPGCTHGIENTTDSLDARVPSSSPAWMPGSPQLTSTVRDLEFVGLSTFPVPLGGGHSCSERLYHFMEQLWSEALLRSKSSRGVRGAKTALGRVETAAPEKGTLTLRHRAEVGGAHRAPYG